MNKTSKRFVLVLSTRVHPRIVVAVEIIIHEEISVGAENIWIDHKILHVQNLCNNQLGTERGSIAPIHGDMPIR